MVLRSSISPGMMRTQLYVKSHTLTSDSQGGQTAAESNDGTVWAQVKPLSGSRLNDYGLVRSQKPREIVMIKPTWEDTADFTIEEGVVLEEVVSGIKLYVHSVIDEDNLGMNLRIIATEQK